MTRGEGTRGPDDFTTTASSQRFPECNKHTCPLVFPLARMSVFCVRAVVFSSSTTGRRERQKTEGESATPDLKICRARWPVNVSFVCSASKRADNIDGRDDSSCAATDSVRLVFPKLLQGHVRIVAVVPSNPADRWTCFGGRGGPTPTAGDERVAPFMRM